MSESTDPDQDVVDDLAADGYEDLPLEAQVAHNRYSYVALAKRDRRTDRRLARGESQRKTIFIVAVCLLVIGVASLGLGIYNMISTNSRTSIRNEQYEQAQDRYRLTQQQLRIVVCAIPPGTDARFDVLRSQSQCGTYVPVAPPTRPGTASPSRTPRPAASVAPSSEPSSRRDVGASTQARTSTKTVSRAVPARPAQPGAPRTSPRATPSAPDVASSSTPGLLPALVCTLFGCTPRP